MTPPYGSSVLMHDDYGPQKVLLDPASGEIAAVVDWEWVHAGARLEALAWCEWIIRMHHPADDRSLGRFFDAYRDHPAWPLAIK